MNLLLMTRFITFYFPFYKIDYFQSQVFYCLVTNLICFIFFWVNFSDNIFISFFLIYAYFITINHLLISSTFLVYKFNKLYFVQPIWTESDIIYSSNIDRCVNWILCHGYNHWVRILISIAILIIIILWIYTVARICYMDEIYM